MMFAYDNNVEFIKNWRLYNPNLNIRGLALYMRMPYLKLIKNRGNPIALFLNNKFLLKITYVLKI